TAEDAVARQKTVELMTMHGQMLYATKIPNVFLIHANADQVRHELRKPVIVIALDPNDFYMPFGIGQLADISQELPMLFFQTAEIQVGKNVSEQNKAVERCRFEHSQRGCSAAYFRAQVKIRNNNRVGKNHVA